MQTLTVKIVELRTEKEAQKLGCASSEVVLLLGKDSASGELYQVTWETDKSDEVLKQITSLLGVSCVSDAKDLSVRIEYDPDGEGQLRIGHWSEDRWLDVEAGGLTGWE